MAPQSTGAPDGWQRSPQAAPGDEQVVCYEEALLPEITIVICSDPEAI